MKQLARNTEGNPEWPNSFIGRLCEDHIWEENEFWLFHKEVTDFIADGCDDDSIPRKFIGPFNRVCYLSLFLYAAHNDPADGYQISNISEQTLRNYIERIEWLIKSLGDGRVPKEDGFYAKNPYL